MTEFLVRYTVNNGVYETRIRTSRSGLAIDLVKAMHPIAKNIHVVGDSYVV